VPFSLSRIVWINSRGRAIPRSVRIGPPLII
jgi:hypothetical protein